MNLDTLEKPSTELTVQDRAALALASDKTRQDLIAMSTKYLAITEIKNNAGRAECHSAAMTLAGARIAISKTGKAARDDATKFSKAIIQEETSLIAIVQPEETRLLALRDFWDEVVAVEKAAREAAERARIAAIVVRISAIREYVSLAAGCRTAARIDELLTKLSLTSLGNFEEFGDEARAAHLAAMQQVTAILEEKTAQEAEQANIKAEQVEAAAKLAAERAEFEAAQAAAKAVADLVAAEHAAQRAAFDATQAALKEKQEAIEKTNRDAAIAEADRMATERQRLADERAAFEAQVAEANGVAEQARMDALAFDAQTELDAQNSVSTQTPETMQEQAPAHAEQAQSAIETEAPVWKPSDAECMWEAIKAVATAFDMTTEQATARLAAIQWTI